MSVKVEYDEGSDVYELGATIDGVFVPFTTLPGATVRGKQRDAANPDRPQFPQKD